MKLNAIARACAALLLPAVLASNVAHAQSTPAFTTGQVPTASQWNSYFGAKVDVIGGTMTSPTLTGPTITGGGALSGTFTGAPTFSGGITLVTPFVGGQVNGLTLSAGATGTNATVTAGGAGSDTNVSIDILPKGTGTVNVAHAVVNASPIHTLNGSSTQLVQSLCVGVGACASYSLSGETSGHGLTAFGENALNHMTQGTAETTAVGSVAGLNLVSGINNTFIGTATCADDQLISFAVCIGNDAGRNMVSTGLNQGLVAIGETAVASGKPSDHQVAIGQNALQGASANVILGGSPTTGDALHVAFAASGSTPAGVEGLPLTVTYTVVSGDTTLAILAGHLGNAINSAINGVIKYGVADGGSGPFGASQVLAPNSPTLLPDGKYAIVLNFPGTTTNGWALTITPTTSGGASETLAVRGGTASTANAAVGGNALQSPAGTLVTYNAVLGDGAMQFANTSSANVAVGNTAAQNCTDCNNSVFVGNGAGLNQQSGNRNIYIGWTAGGSTCATGGFNLIIGAGDCFTSSDSNLVNIKGLLYYNTNSTAAPALTSCGTSPAIDAHANNRSGTVTMGTGAPTACTITFAFTAPATQGYSTWVHCRVTSESQLASFAYSYTTSAITIAQTGTSSNKVDYDCDGY